MARTTMENVPVRERFGVCTAKRFQAISPRQTHRSDRSISAAWGWMRIKRRASTGASGKVVSKRARNIFDGLPAQAFRALEVLSATASTLLPPSSVRLCSSGVTSIHAHTDPPSGFTQCQALDRRGGGGRMRRKWFVMGDASDG